MRRLMLNLSTTACVVLFSMAAFHLLEDGNLLLAAVYLIFAFYVPLSDDLDVYVKTKFGLRIAKEDKEVDRCHDANEA